MRQARQEFVRTAGGQTRARVILLLALVLGLSSADTSAVGAAAAPLQRVLRINFTQIGLLVALTALAAAAATIPIGALSDRMNRVRLLKWSIVIWSLAMIAAGAATSYGMLLVSRLILGAVTATTGPTLASLTGDFFAPQERGRVYGLILAGDLLGSVAGLFVSGNLAAISWRWAFWALVIPSAALAWAIGRYMPEPARGGSGRLAAEPRSGPRGAQPAASGPVGDPADPPPAGAQNVPRSEMSLWEAVRYVLSVRTNLALILASALGYFFISGVLTFGVIFMRHQYSVGQSTATSLLAVLSVTAVIGVIASGRLADALIRRGRVSGRMIVAAGTYLAASVLFVVPLLSRSLILGLPLLWLAGAALYGSNPPLDAARLDVMPHWLWGRAEGVRMALRSLATATAPLLFGFVSDLIGGAGAARHAPGAAANAGAVSDTFLIMLVPLAAGGLILWRARHGYARDAAAAAHTDRTRR